MQVHGFSWPRLRPGKLVEPVRNNGSVMTVHTKLIMSVSLWNKGGRHVPPQQGPKLILQPQSRHTTQHADGQTCRHTCTDSRASGEVYTSMISTHIYRYKDCKCIHTFNFLERCSQISQYLCATDRSRTSAHHMNTVALNSLKRLRISQMHERVSMTIT